MIKNCEEALKTLEIKYRTIANRCLETLLEQSFSLTNLQKKEFIYANGWLKEIYPICDLEKYIVIFLSTKKFVSPMNTFGECRFIFIAMLLEAN